MCRVPRLAGLLFVSVALLAAGCGSDDPIGVFAGQRAAAGDGLVNETEALDVDLDALEAAAEPTPSLADEAEDEAPGVADDDTGDGLGAPSPIEVPDGAIDWTAFDRVDIDIQDNAFTQRTVVVRAGTTVTWTNQGRNEHNVRPAIDAAFEPIATADLAVKGDSASLVFATPGDFPYFCSLHGTARNGQTARIIVVP